MTILTSSATLTVGDGSVVTESVSFSVLPALPGGSGKGRLIHPTLGSYDYDVEPVEWSNMYADAIVRPFWSSSLTLDGASSTLWAGGLKDVECEERWSGELAMRSSQLSMLLAMYQDPPDPETAWVQWWPSYINDLGFYVLLTGLDVGGSGAMVLDGWVHGGYVSKAVTLKLRIVGRVP